MRINNFTGTLRTLAGFLLLSGTFACDASVLDLASRADLIVVGRATTRIESSTNLSFDLNVDRILKGDQSSSTFHICHDWHSSGLSSNSIQIQTGTFYGIWFLISEAPGSWDALPITKDGFIFSLFLPASEQPASPYVYPPGTAYLDALVYEIGAGFEKFPGTAQSMLLPVSITGTAMDTIIARFASSQNGALRAAGVAEMLARSQEQALDQLRQAWPVVEDAPTRALLISEVRDAFRNTDPHCIAQLIAMSGDKALDSGLRSAAIKAIKAVHTRESVPFLAGLLSSPDLDEQIDAVIGLSSFANGCPPQTPANVASMDYMQFKNTSLYRTPQTIAAFAFGAVSLERQAELVGFWTDWWNQNKQDFIR